ncbi:MAG: fibronectin type III domain-containing protein, partial [Chloroflexota bacterium]|nr:fibronectin type III domain-containing protein [Chloroflexota bacterium]
TQTLPEAAGGAGGFTYSLSPDLPAGLSFDPASRALTGTPSEGGEHTMIYTATDADGTQVGLSFQIVILATALQLNDDAALEKPGTPTVSRKTFSEPTNPALEVTWTAPTSGATPTGYEAQYRKQAEDPAAWTPYSGALGATATSLTLSDLEAGATYEVQVLALNNDERGPWSDTGTGRANRAPTATSAFFNGGTFSVGSTADYRETGPGALGVFFADADGDALTYAAAAQHPALLGVSLSGSAGSAHLRATLLNQGSSKLTLTARDPYGGSVTRTATISITAKTSRDIAENSAAGTAVGNPVTGTPYNGGALSYTLKGKAKDSGKFVIDAASGQISVKQGATLDYETDDSNRETETFNGQVIAKFYRGEVHYTVDGHAAAINVNIKVTDVETGKPDAPTLTRTQYSEPTNPGLDVTWTAPAANGLTISGYNVQYRKKASDGEKAAAWTAYSGTIGGTATSVTLSDLEAGATYEAQVRAETSEEGEGPWSDTGTGRANRPPTTTSALFNGGTFSVGSTADYNETGNGALGVMFADADGDALTYAAAAQHPALLGVSLSGAAGQAQLRVTLLNQGSSNLTYTATDPYGGSVTRTATIGITAKTSRSIAENSAAGTAVGDPVTGTPYNGVALSYTLKGNAKDSGKFVVDSSTGQISVKQGATLDYETDNSNRETETSNGQIIAKFYRGEVHYTVDGHAAVINVTIKVTDVEAGQPAAPTLTR